MISYLLQVTLCMAVFYAFYYFALRKETFFHSNRFYLLITLLLSLVLPLTRIYVNLLQADPIVQAPVFVGAYFQNLENGIVVTPEDHSFPWKQVLMVIYATGVGLMTIRLLLSLQALRSLRKKASVLLLENQLCAVSPQVQSPFSFFNTIYLPADHSFTEEELKEVICHEHAHVAGKHSWDVLLVEIINILIWPNPVIYLYKSALKEIHEYVADAAVIRHDPWEKYAQFLIAQKYVGLQSRLSNQLIYSQLKNRLVMMTQKPSSLLAKWKYSGVLPILLMTLLIFSFRDKDNTFASVPGIIPGTSINQALDDNTEPPLFPGCDKVNEMEKADCSHQKLYEYVASHLIYPEELKAAKIEGKVYIKFLITNNGYVSDARVQKSLHPAADKAALEVVNGMNANVGKWTPGTKEGIPVTMDMVLPISFVLGPLPGTPSKDESGSQLNANSSPEVYTYVEEMPRFPGCEDQDPDTRFKCVMGKLYQYVSENIQYPKQDQENKKEGTVIAQFVVQADGLVSDVKILKGVTPDMDAEVIRIINGMNSMSQRWIPGKNAGKAVAVSFTLPVKFALQTGQQNAKDPASPQSSPSTADEMKKTTVHDPIDENGNPVPGSLHLAPNPARDHIVVDLFEGAHTIFIFAADGVQIAKVDVSKSTETRHWIDLIKYPAGQYSMQVISSKESRSGLFTVVK